jgi:hypothetical protein
LSRYLNAPLQSMRTPTAAAFSSRSRRETSSHVMGGLRSQVQVSPLPSHASNVIGYCETKKVVGPVLSKSLATLTLIPCTAAEITTTTKTPTATPRIVRPARTLLPTMASTAMRTPSPRL